MHKHGALCLPFFPRAVELCPRSTGVFLRRDTKAESLGFFSEFSDLALKAISPFSDRFPEVARHMGRLKKVPPRSARVGTKFEEKLASVQSNQDPARSKAHVPAPIRYTERLALAPESLTFWRPILRNLGSGQANSSSRNGNFWTCDLATLEKHRILAGLFWPLVARNFGIRAFSDGRGGPLRCSFRRR